MAGITAAAIGALSGAVVVLATPRQRGYSHRLAGRANGRGLVESQGIVRAGADFSRRIGRIGPRADIEFRELRNGLVHRHPGYGLPARGCTRGRCERPRPANALWPAPARRPASQNG